MANSSLRELAKEHAQGNLDKETYRKSRAALIQGIVSHKIPLKQIDYPPLVQPPEPESLDETQRKEDNKKPPAASTSPGNDSAENTSNDNNNNAGSGTNKILIVGLIVGVIAIIIVAVLALKGGGTSKKSGSVTRTGTQNIEVTRTKTKTQDLVENFLNQKNWSSANLDSFLRQLSPEEQLASKDSLEIGQLTNAIYKQLLEEQALSGLLDDDSSLVKQGQLVEFAEELGIEDARISLPDDVNAVEVMTEDTEPTDDSFEVIKTPETFYE